MLPWIKPAHPYYVLACFAAQRNTGLVRGYAPSIPTHTTAGGRVSKVQKITTVSVRIDKPTAAEWRERATASGLSVSDWIRGAVDANQQTNLPTPQRRPVRVRDTSNDADPALMRQLAGMSNNLNQIARALNECRLAGSSVQLVEVLALLRSIEVQAGRLLPQLPPPPKPAAKGHDDAH